jgi:ABC-type transport system involved in multi-copper enzyme maturation permease subunit
MSRPDLATMIRTEVLKLRTTWMWWVLLAIGVAITGAYAVLLASITGRTFGGAPATPPPSDPATLRTIYGLALSVGYLIPLVLGIVAMTGEYRHRTITSTLLACPRRGRVVGAKLITYFAVGLAMGAVFTVVALALGGSVIAARGYPLGLGADGVGRTLALATLGCGIWTTFGVGLGTLVRNQLAAIGIALALQLLVEQLLALGLNQVPHGGQIAQYLPSSAAAAMISGASGGVDLQMLPWWGGTAVLAGYGACFALLGLALTSRRDVT